VFFAAFREAVARLPAGLVRPSRPATAGELAAAEKRGTALPPALRAFLSSFDGVDLFHETWVIAGVGPDAPRSLAGLDPADLPLREGDCVVGEAANGDHLLLEASGRVIRVPAGSDERWLAGTALEPWLLAVIAHERLLYDSDGEFSLEAFEEDGAEVKPRLALRQAERASKHDSEAADWHHEQGIAYRRLGRWEDAAQAFARAAACDPPNGWPLFDEGRAWLRAAEEQGSRALAATAAARLAEAARRADADLAPRLWAWSARAALAADDAELVGRARAEALRLAPELAGELQRAADQAAADEDDDAEDANDERDAAHHPADDVSATEKQENE